MLSKILKFSLAVILTACRPIPVTVNPPVGTVYPAGFTIQIYDGNRNGAPDTFYFSYRHQPGIPKYQVNVSVPERSIYVDLWPW